MPDTIHEATDAVTEVGIHARVKTRVVGVEITLTDAQANQLYNDIYAITGAAGISTVSERGGHFRALFALYDAAGIDGSGGVSGGDS